MTKWKCTECGYIHQGKNPPDRCPNCQAPKWRFILLEPLPPAVEEGLRLAFAAESKASVRLWAFAAQADGEGYPAIARLFRAVAEAERVHADEYLRYLEGVVGDTEQNLKTAFEKENLAKDEAYPALIKTALNAKREDVSWSLIRARDVEGQHAKLYKQALSALASEREIEYHVCTVCGYVFDTRPGETCPVCRSGAEKFKLVP